MNQQSRRNLKGTALLATALLVAGNIAHATPTSDDQSLARGAVEDITPQQKYRTAIREAGGALKESLRECTHVAGDDRQVCLREAQSTYDRDMADAKQILRTWVAPDSRPR